MVDKNKPDLKRNKPAADSVVEEEKKDVEVSAGNVGLIIDYVFNATEEKMREVTIIDKMQGRLLPLLDLMNEMWGYVLELALYRQDSEQYEMIYLKKMPVPPNLIQIFIHRTAQWQKSVAGKNLEKAIDLALAEVETRAVDDEALDDPSKHYQG